MPLAYVIRDADYLVAAFDASAASKAAASATSGLVCDGTADDVELNAVVQSGRPVRLTEGTYQTVAPRVIPRNATVQGPHAPRWFAASGTGTPTQIRPQASFTGTAVVWMKDKEQGGYAVEQGGQRLVGISIDGGALPGGNTVHGFYASGRVRDVRLENTHVTQVGGDGYKTAAYTRLDASTPRPMAWKLANAVADACGGDGFDTDLLFDSTYIDCVAIGCTGNGYNLSAPGACSFIGCRAEFNGIKGFSTVGQFNGDLVFSACRTDRNQQDGFWFGGVTSGVGGNSAHGIVLTGCQSGRDGKNGNAGGGNWAGFAAHENLVPVIFNGCTVHPGVEDDGSGVQSPQYAIRVRHLTGSTVPRVHLSGGMWWGATGTLLNDGNARVRVDSTAEAATGSATATPTVDNTFGGFFPNRGLVTTASGTTAFGAAVTSVTGIAHGLGVTPAAKDFSLQYVADPLAAGHPWVSAITSTTFTLNVKTAPGGAGTTVGWQAQVL